ncbi:ATP-binding protein [Streptomyces sp. D2-8]|uniref:ATP-binding protein n=1 Tax=Streptomyces sp. D2-8 TaxID=2707767 RepID=UPI0020BFBE12|nr:ATP-binding protein [Streptomyces sp. D2-8]
MPGARLEARRLAHDPGACKFIAPHNPVCSVDDCALMISELVTNAIAYGRSDEPWPVRVEWFREGTSLRVDVHNPGFPANVRLRHPDANDSHGRGLLLVDSLAESWHAAPSRFGGTVVSQQGQASPLRRDQEAAVRSLSGALSGA